MFLCCMRVICSCRGILGHVHHNQVNLRHAFKSQYDCHNQKKRPLGRENLLSSSLENFLSRRLIFNNQTAGRLILALSSPRM